VDKKRERAWKGVCIHHSFSPDRKTSDWEGIRRFHTSYRQDGQIISKGLYERLKSYKVSGLTPPWSDIGYHFGVELVGEGYVVKEGRPLNKSGAHCPCINSTHIGICVVGNFDANHLPTPALVVLTQLVKDLARRYGFILTEPGVVTYHNQHSQKTCPGKLFPTLETFLKMLDK